MYSATLKNVKEENGEKVYQCQKLEWFDEAVIYYTRNHTEFCTQVTECLRSRVAWSDQEVICDIISTLTVQGWEKIREDETPLDFIDRLVDRFATPLQGAQIDVGKIREEFESLMQYAIQFISLATMDYHAAWWRIFHAPTASEWYNGLILSNFCFLFLHPMESLSVFSHK